MIGQVSPPWWSATWIHDPVQVAITLLGVLALVFAAARHPRTRALFKVVPLLVFCYFVPTILSNTGVIPGAPPDKGMPGFPLYEFVMDWLLPASLLLLILAVDLPAILGLGRNAVILFLVAAGSMTLAGPLAYAALGWMLDAEAAPQAWRGLAALCGSWIGGGANFAAIGRSVGAEDSMLSAIVVVDVAIANVWMMALLYFADRHERVDARIGADASAVDEVRRRAEAYAAETARPTDLPGLMTILAIALGGTWLASWLAAGIAHAIPDDHLIETVLSEFGWKILLVTALGLGLSFTPARHLEGVGASKVGSVFLYLLVTSIGARADFAKVADPKNLPLIAIGALWMLIHVACVLGARRWLRAPIFFAAVGSKACVGGAASAPIVASAFSPALAPVGALLAIGGYVLGTVCGLACAFMLEALHLLYHG